MDKDTANKYAGTSFTRWQKFEGVYYRAQYNPYGIYLHISRLNTENVMGMRFSPGSKMVDMEMKRFHTFGLTGNTLENPAYVSKMIKDIIKGVFYG